MAPAALQRCSRLRRGSGVAADLREERAHEVEAEPHALARRLGREERLSEPPLEYRLAKLATVEGTVPSPDSVSASCTFAARCRWVAPACTAEQPPLAPAGPARLSACLRIGDIAAEIQTESALVVLALRPLVTVQAGAGLLALGGPRAFTDRWSPEPTR